MLTPSPAAASIARSPVDQKSRILGMQDLVSRVFAEADIQPVWNMLMQRVAEDGSDAAAMLDLATILQTLGRTADARRVLDGAVAMRRDYCVVHGDGSGPSLLAFVTPGDFMANTPLDFLLEGSNCLLWLHYVDAGTENLDQLPEYDVAFMAIGESTENAPVLERMKDLLRDFTGPIMNNDPDMIRNLTRDGVSSMLAAEPSILSPRNLRLTHADLAAVAAGEKTLIDCAPDLAFPLVVRPLSTHAGHGMERVGTISELATWLSSQSAAELFVAPFIDFRGPDGLYNKQRIVFIKGKAFASHMALSDHWIVHYLSAGMAESPAKRAVEQEWMENFDTDFAVRYSDAFAALYQHIGLDYFGIDCAEMADGRLLVFELDVAMVVHSMDSAEVYPYKKVAMRKLFDAFVDSILDTAVAAQSALPATDDATFLECLVSGGDDRLDCDPQTGLNMYGYGPRPRPSDLAFGSSTASTISASAFEAMQVYHDRLTSELKTLPAEDVYAREMGEIRRELLDLLGLNRSPEQPRVDAVMAASGTDIHLFASTLVAGQDPRTLMTITLTGSETGSGVMMAAAGRHFMNRPSSGADVMRGEPVNGGTSMRSMTVSVRDTDGTLRAEDDVELELRGAIELARAAGMRCLLVATDVSKTGLVMPGLDIVQRLKTRFGEMLDVLIDGCQFRLSARTIRAYLAHDFMVAVTGSKFLAGPIFSAALLCPDRWSQRLKSLPLPHAFADYSVKADWPDGWAAQATLPARANPGLLLRWKAALFELRAFVDLSEEEVQTVVSTFGKAVAARLTRDDAFEMLDTRSIERHHLQDDPEISSWDEMPTILSFYLRRPMTDSMLTTAETTEIYRALATDHGDVLPVRLGQPVRSGEIDGESVSALRICLSAPLIVSASRSPEALDVLIDQAMMTLDGTAAMVRHMFPPVSIREARYS